MRALLVSSRRWSTLMLKSTPELQALPPVLWTVFHSPPSTTVGSKSSGMSSSAVVSCCLKSK
eukprot:3283409-Prymnesium_polylepis.1